MFTITDTEAMLMIQHNALQRRASASINSANSSIRQLRAELAQAYADLEQAYADLEAERMARQLAEEELAKRH
jgi:hypothetical protein